MRAIVVRDTAAVRPLLAAAPSLASARLVMGASRQQAKAFFLEEITHCVYAGDTALHVAAAAHRPELVQQLLELGADVRARNRRGAEPLHYAVDGGPGSPAWMPTAQATTVTRLIEAGADPNAADQSGVAPLHRAVRNRCASAVRALLEGGADPGRRNKSGSTPMQLAEQNTGKSGSGSPEAKAQREEIVRLLS